MRCFAAISLPEPVLDALEVLQSEIPVGRATPRDNLHLTLSFLGELSEQEARQVHMELAQVQGEPFPVEIAGLDLFGGRKPQILFASVRQHGALQELQRRVVGAVRKAGIELRRERFRPHVTLARFNRPPSPSEADRLGAFLQARGLFSTDPFTAESFGLFQSVLGNGPAVHTELAHYPLAGAEV